MLIHVTENAGNLFSVTTEETKPLTSLEFYLLTLASEAEGTDTLYRNDIIDQYLPVICTRIAPCRYVLANPQFSGTMTKLPSHLRWPYAACLMDRSVKQTLVYDGVTIRVNSDQFNILFFALRINYETCTITELAFALGSEQPQIYANDTLIYGITLMFDAIHSLNSAMHVVMSNSDTKAKMLALASMIKSTYAVKGEHMVRPLFVSLDELLRIVHPGVNLEYPKIAENVLNVTTAPQGWHTDYTLIGYDPAQKVTFMRTIAMPMLYNRIQVAIHNCIDLRSAIVPCEYKHLLSIISSEPHLIGHSTIYLMPRIRIPAAMHFRKLSLATGTVVHYYKLNDVITRACVAVKNGNGTYSAIRTYHNSEVVINVQELWESMNPPVLAVIDECVATAGSIPGLHPIFIAEFGTLISERGTFSMDKHGRCYGLGALGHEGSLTLAVATHAHAQFSKNADAALSFINRESTAYNILVPPTANRRQLTLCTETERLFMQNTGLSVPKQFWRDPDSTFTNTFNQERHAYYNGSFIPTIRNVHSNHN